MFQNDAKQALNEILSYIA